MEFGPQRGTKNVRPAPPSPAARLDTEGERTVLGQLVRGGRAWAAVTAHGRRAPKLTADQTPPSPGSRRVATGGSSCPVGVDLSFSKCPAIRRLEHVRADHQGQGV